MSPARVHVHVRQGYQGINPYGDREAWARKKGAVDAGALEVVTKGMHRMVRSALPNVYTAYIAWFPCLCALHLCMRAPHVRVTVPPCRHAHRHAHLQSPYCVFLICSSGAAAS